MQSVLSALESAADFFLLPTAVALVSLAALAFAVAVARLCARWIVGCLASVLPSAGPRQRRGAVGKVDARYESPASRPSG